MMTEQVSEAIFYHINRNANLSPFPRMGQGDTIEVGNITNPFFRFYEIYHRTYPVNITETGTTENIGAMSFLKHVRSGGQKTPMHVKKWTS